MLAAFLRGALALSTILSALLAFAGTPGSFRGVLVAGANTKPGWVYVQSRNDMLRLVDGTRATIRFDEQVPDNEKVGSPREGLRPGAEVRVLAEQDRHGQWRAREIQILRLPPARQSQR